MGFLLMLSRKIQLQDKLNNLEYQVTTLNAQLGDLTTYCSILAQDSVSLGDLANIPSSLFGQAMGHLANADMFAQQVAQNNFNQAMSSGLFGQADNPYVQQITMQKMYEDGRKQYQKQLMALLNEQEKSKKQTVARLQAQIELTQKELEKVEQREAQDAEKSVCGYGLRA